MCYCLGTYESCCQSINRITITITEIRYVRKISGSLILFKLFKKYIISEQLTDIQTLVIGFVLTSIKIIPPPASIKIISILPPDSEHPIYVVTDGVNVFLIL